MANNDLVFYVKLYVNTECVEEWKRAVTEMIERMSLEDAFVSCYLHQDKTRTCLRYTQDRRNLPLTLFRSQMKPYRVAYDAKLPRPSRVTGPLLPLTTPSDAAIVFGVRLGCKGIITILIRLTAHENSSWPDLAEICRSHALIVEKCSPSTNWFLTGTTETIVALCFYGVFYSQSHGTVRAHLSG